ncbi:MAG TPA: 3-phosphoshikimate 1-carboxyvinyltransferase [Blastocatellia bacterium]|nr:3-phosphoshikimate 1-carboxyvinyltransferase [Blastocatellia bacterium]
MSRSMRIKGKANINGIVSVPGDKSISHRVAMLASIARGVSRITNFATSVDCHTTLDSVERLGVRVERNPQEILIHGEGLDGFRPIETPIKLNAGNSGSTIRMLSGILAGQRFTSITDGDASLGRRPLRRIIEPLILMGAQIRAREGNYTPLEIRGGALKAINYASQVASAQVKTCVLFAGLFADGRTTFNEPAPSRNHTELMLEEFGAQFKVDETSGDLSIEGGSELTAVRYRVPGDISSAAFFIAAAALLPDSRLELRDVNLNPSRTAFLDVLSQLGASIQISNLRTVHRELVADICVTSSQLKSESQGTVLSGSIIPNIIDEIPILAIVATQVEGRIEVRGARELRIKESDRVQTVVAGIRALGGEIEEFEDGFAICGPQNLKAGRIETDGDHRIAMAFSIAALIADGTTEIVDADCAGVSFPEFYELLRSLTSEGHIE